MATQILTPVGRIVWGHPGKAQKKTDQKTKQPILRDGKQVEQWAFGIAFPKDVFNAQIWPQLHAEAATVYPQGFPPTFSWKFKDGDSVDRQGKPYSAREGYAGHYVLTVSTEAFAPPMFKFENGAYRQITADEIKCGDYVVLNLNAKANKPVDVSHTPGIYINPNGLELVGYGQEIVSAGADPDAMFGAGGQRPGYALPAGASTTPISSAPSGAAMPGHAPAAPVAAAPAPLPPAAPVAPAPVAFPPAGWTAHPSAPGYFYSGQEVLDEATLRAKFAKPAVPAAPAAPAAPVTLPAPAHDFVAAAAGAPPAAPVAAAPGGLPAGMPLPAGR